MHPPTVNPHLHLLFLLDELLTLTNIQKKVVDEDLVPPGIVPVNVCPWWFGLSGISLRVQERRPAAQCIDWLIIGSFKQAWCSSGPRHGLPAVNRMFLLHVHLVSLQKGFHCREHESGVIGGLCSLFSSPGEKLPPLLSLLPFPAAFVPSSCACGENVDGSWFSQVIRVFGFDGCGFSVVVAPKERNVGREEGEDGVL